MDGERNTTDSAPPENGGAWSDPWFDNEHDLDLYFDTLAEIGEDKENYHDEA